MKHPEIVKIHDSIKQDYYSEFGWTSGGCFALAEGLVAGLPKSELWAVGQKCEDDWAAQHAVMRYQDKFYDADGESSKETLLRTYSWKSSPAKLDKVSNWVRRMPPNELWYPEQEFVSDKQIKTITKIFKQMLRASKPNHR